MPATKCSEGPRNCGAAGWWVVLLCAALLWVGCGVDAVGPTACDGDCFGGKPAVCDGGQLVEFQILGTCEEGVCRFDERARRTCVAGCENGACLAEAVPCGGDCESPPAATCEGDEAVTYADAGTCDASTDVCTYPARFRNNCAANDLRCVQGRCVQVDVCDEGACAAVPGAACEGDILLTAAGPGACTETAFGELCVRPEVLRQDCAARGETCREGACVALPCESGCGDTAPFCDRSTAVVPQAPSICDGRTGTCSFEEVVRTNCALTGDTCVEGRCVGPGAPCQGASCTTPPAPTCASSRQLERYSDAGVCDEDRNVCTYAPLREACPTGTSCRDGVCASDSCDGVACSTPPAATCAGSVRLRYAGRGTCRDGACDYVEERLDCQSRGETCVAGACVAVCADVGCPVAPPPACVGDALVFFEGAGVCEVAGCRYGTLEIQCGAAGGTCRDGRCVAACNGALCEPPAPLCEGTTAVETLPADRCDPVDGSCSFQRVRRNCALDGLVCIDGDCVADPCTTASCEVTPGPTCEANVLVESFGTGVCVAGGCQFASRRTDCGATGATCNAGSCVGGCTPADCDAPPAWFCRGATAVRPTNPGVCTGGACQYVEVTEDCDAQDARCVQGVCIPQTCPAGGCGAPPAPYCDGDTVVASTAPVTCSFEACIWTLARTDCPPDTFCTGGVCQSSNPCEGDCSTPPVPYCSGDVRVAPLAPGRCDLGLCYYEDDARQDCRASGLVCRAGACVPNPCVGVVCTTPPAPVCEGDFSRIPLAPGVCDEGRCVYPNSRTEDCLAVAEGTCQGGVCIVQVGCEVTGCAQRPTVCDGNDVVRYSGAGVCGDDGKCDYDAVFSVTPCGTSEVCREGACVAAPDLGTGDVLFSELMINPAAGSDPWIELYVPGFAQQAVGGYRLDVQLTEAGNGTRAVSATLPAGTSIAGNGFLVVAAGPAPFPGYTGPTTGPWGTWSVATFTLLDDDGRRVSRMVVARALWPDTRIGASLQTREAPMLSRQDSPSDWCESAALTPGSQQSTPGAANGVCVDSSL